MEVLTLLMFIGIVLLALTLLSFSWTVRVGSLQHADRLALLPLDDGDTRRLGTEVEKGVDVQSRDGAKTTLVERDDIR